ncbi:SDR family oxidoreductase [Streptomyces sp. NPDC002889]|uniref:SDR family oxidoreductase n=1 Tax=Streptomyces sp. NPDC002889 TaxID=3364669 RepID=UPI0036A98CAB
MRIAIAGGTGTLGRHTADELRGRGHEVRVLSRHSPEYRVDLTTGEGLAEALAGCDTVVDASNSPSPKQAEQILVEGSRRLLAAEEASGVGHHVCVSIVGCDRVPMGYHRSKAQQERVVESGQVPWTVVRATQFHELLAAGFAAVGRARVLPIPRARLQPVACAEVARVVADAVEGGPRRGRVEVTGPETADLRVLARRWRAITGRRALVLPLPLPGALGRALRSGVATSDHPDVRGTVRFDDWLRAQTPAGRADVR